MVGKELNKLEQGFKIIRFSIYYYIYWDGTKQGITADTDN